MQGWREAIAGALQSGFSFARLLPADALDYVPNAEGIRQRIESDPRALLAGAKSVLVMAVPFQWFAPWPSGYGEVSAFYFVSQQTHRMVLRVGERLTAGGARISVDQRLPAKPLGVRAGLGRMGKNGLLRNAAWGSCMSIRMLTTDIRPPEASALEPSLAAPTCGGCHACVSACPTGALRGDGQLEPSKCLRAHMLAGTIVPEPLRGLMGGRLLGCEICQRVCPHNAHIQPVAPETCGFGLPALLRSDGSDRAAIAAAIGWNEARMQRLKAQAALVAGNTGNAAHLPALRKMLASERPAVRVHAQWAAERIRERSRF